MNGLRVGCVFAVVALLATISVGCASSRGRGCRNGSCRVSSTAAAVPPRRSDVAQVPAVKEPPRVKVQQTCPVTGEKLGSMGSPIPVTIGGTSIQVCCNGCVAAVQKNPDKYLKIVADELATSDPSAARSEAFYNRPGAAERGARSSDGHHH